MSKGITYFLENKGFFRAPPLIFFARWWPGPAAYIFGSYFFSGDRKDLGDLAWVWYGARGAIVILAIICLIWHDRSQPREWLGYGFVVYGIMATWSYYTTTEIHDKLFWGELTRTVAFAFLMLALTYCSFFIIDRLRVYKAAEAQGLQPPII